MRRKLWAIVGAVPVLASCGAGAHHGATPTTDPPTSIAPVATTTTPSTTQPAPTTTVPASTTVPDPVSIPPTIDIPYVNAVLAQLNHVYGDAQRIEISTKFLPTSIPPMLRAIYGDAQYSRELSVFSQALQGPTLSEANPNSGDPKMTVTKVVMTKVDCIQAAVNVDDSTAAPAAGPLPLVVVLRPKPTGNDPGGLNKTPWNITYEMGSNPLGPDAC